MYDHHLKAALSPLVLFIALFTAEIAKANEEKAWAWTQNTPGNETSSESQSLNITFKEKVIFKHSEIYLSDLIECQDQSPNCEATKHFFIDKAPEPGSEKKLQTNDIIKKIQSEWSDITLRAQGPTQISLESEGEAITNQEINSYLKELLDAINARFDNLEFHAEISQRDRSWVIRPGLRNLTFPEVMLQHQMSRSRLKDLFRNKRNLKIQIFTPDQSELISEKTVPIVFTTRIKSLVASRDFPRNHLVQDNDFALEWIHLTGRESQFLTELKTRESFKLRRDIQAGKALKKSDLTKNFIIKRGQVLNMNISEDGLDIKVLVRARESGAIGDIIQTVYEPTKKRLIGKIVSENSLTYMRGDLH